ncbi:MAG: hypothetical protein A2885_17185 [Sphingopyxis sp. RIFCSPHIGHO2_01_FULL_65_24]|nr:MAG: hypothetical protein A2885_17185 [Sphingopyxis sp. RIFCSPHIGHO2_01_FULL_65_24]
MSISESFLDTIFTVTDPDARLRKPGALFEFETWRAGDALPAGAAVGGFKTIPKNSKVKVEQIKIEPSGSQSKIVFALVAPAAGGAALGWTSTRNFSGSFRNVTLGKIAPAPGAGQFGPNAAWKGGAYQGQITLVPIVDRTLEIEYLSEAIVEPYQKMVAAAAADGIAILLNSGFRTYSSQKYLYEGYVAGRPGFNKAAKPGSSNHQHGIALDIDTAGGLGSPTYDWLAKHATRFGFIRTVPSEAWHWEHRPAAAATARAAGKHQL